MIRPHWLLNGTEKTMVLTKNVKGSEIDAHRFISGTYIGNKITGLRTAKACLAVCSVNSAISGGSFCFINVTDVASSGLLVKEPDV